MINIDGNFVYDERRVPLAKVLDFGRYVRVIRQPACSVGDYFAILTFLLDWGYRVV